MLVAEGSGFRCSSGSGLVPGRGLLFFVTTYIGIFVRNCPSYVDVYVSEISICECRVRILFGPMLFFVLPERWIDSILCKEM